MKFLRRHAVYGLLAPFFLFFAFFWVAPLLEGLRMSFFSNELFGEASFVGGENYRDILKDSRYYKALRNTAVYTLSSLVLILPVAMILAHGLKSVFGKLRPAFQFLLLLPGLTPPAVLALLFLLVFHGRQGLLNQWFVLPFGWKYVNWLKDPDFILFALVLQCVWRWVGFITFFLLSGMEAIPKMYYEALQVESARSWHRFRWVTFPFLRHVILFCIVYLIVDAFALFSGAYVLLGGSGGTADAGLLMVSYTYQTAFTFGNFGTAAAMSVLMAPFLLFLLWACFWGYKRLSRESPAKE
ncbi:MAG: sugar ABC transporter permease [Verrucomicrobia bacterium]|jgi:ABC-type sugar transport system permease subunit|nr:sugar ABC transporter permease [Verrucomicrobiota bacterium]